MNWLTLILMLLSYFTSSKGTSEERTNALFKAGLVGVAANYATGTDWGKANLPGLDAVFSGGTGKQTVNGVEYVVPNGATLAKDANGNVILDSEGKPTYITTNADGTTSLVSTVGEVLKSWGGGGTAAVIGTTAAASGAFGSIEKYLPLILLAGAVFLITR